MVNLACCGISICHNNIFYAVDIICGFAIIGAARLKRKDLYLHT